jgi:lipocalin
VGSPDRKYLWVLARDRKMAEETYAEIQERAASMGFDISRVRRTAQEE